VAPSSSAKKVAKLASRGKGKKVRFQGGTTFPTVVAVVSVVMVALIAYARISMPGVETGAPQPGDSWHIAYGIRVCDSWLPTLQGTPAELDLDVSTGNQEELGGGAATSQDGVIHYHPQVGGATGGKARLGVFLDQYGISLSDTELKVPAALAGDDGSTSWNVDTFQCDGKDTQIRVRVWDDYTTGSYSDKVTGFRNLRFTRSGMVFTIAIVPKDDDIPQPDSVAELTNLNVPGAGGAATTVPSGDTTAPGDTTATGDTTAPADTTVTGDTTADTVTATTGG